MLRIKSIKDAELKARETKIKKEIEELFIKPIISSINDMDKFEKEELKNIRSVKNTWDDWLINHIPKPIRKNVCVFKDKTVSIFKTNTPKQTVYGGRKKLSSPRKQNI